MEYTNNENTFSHLWIGQILKFIKIDILSYASKLNFAPN